MRHLFYSIDALFRPNNPLDLAREGPILLKKTSKGDVQLIKRNTVLDWVIETDQQTLTLTST